MSDGNSQQPADVSREGKLKGTWLQLYNLSSGMIHYDWSLRLIKWNYWFKYSYHAKCSSSSLYLALLEKNNRQKSEYLRLMWTMYIRPHALHQIGNVEPHRGWVFGFPSGEKRCCIAWICTVVCQEKEGVAGDGRMHFWFKEGKLSWSYLFFFWNWIFCSTKT